MALIEMVERGYAGPNELKSSWAGAMGQPQFMPDVYLTMAADWDGDGRRDIWTNTGDVLASIANYLAKHGWRTNGPIFEEVQLPPGFDYALADNQIRPLTEWAQRNVRRIDGAPWAPGLAGERAELFLPAGWQDRRCCCSTISNIIKTYNNSDRYALAVSLLARAFEGKGGLVRPWPTQLGALRRDDMLALQQSLSRLGYGTIKADGMFGDNTRQAVRSFQIAQKLPADGYPTDEILRRATALDPAALSPAARLEASRKGSPLLGLAGVKQLQQGLNRLGYKLGAPNGKNRPQNAGRDQGRGKADGARANRPRDRRSYCRRSRPGRPKNS